MSLGAAARHHLVFYAISARSAATYTVQLNGLVWEWLASDRDGDVVLDNTKADGDWAKNFCTAQAQAEMIRNANNVNCVGKRNLRCCMFTIQTRRNAGAYANDDLGGTNTITGNTAADDINMISVDRAPNAFCVWDKRN